MASIHRHVSVTHRPEYGSHAEVLDLSRPRSSPAKDDYYEEHPKILVHPPAQQVIAEVRRRESASPKAAYKSPDRSAEETYHQVYPADSSRSPPSFYVERKEARSRQTSPNYASCYPGTEHLSQYVLQAAYQQQMILQQHQNVKPPTPKAPLSVESDAASEAGSDSSVFPMYSMVTGRDGKMTRPFKAYPKDPLSFSSGFSSIDSVIDTQSAEKYTAFRKRMLDQICAANGGQATVSNPKMRRTVVNVNGTPASMNNNNYSDDGGKDEAAGSKYDTPNRDNSYTERRRKNNAAAKKSRDRRRIKEDEIAIRAAFLERENIELKFELAAARKQLASCGIAVPNC